MSIDLEQEFMSTEYHDLSDSESPPSPSPTPKRASPSISSDPSTSLPVADAATFVLPQPSSSATPEQDAPKVSHAEDDPTDLAQSGHSPWRLQWKKDNPNWRYSAEDAEDRIARGLTPIRYEATLMRELDKLVNRPPGQVAIAPLRSRRPKVEIDGPWRDVVKEESEGADERGMKTTAPLDQLNSTLSPALPFLDPDSSSSTPSPPSPSNEHSDSLLPPRIPPSLRTLPLDIIHEIVDQGGPDFVFPLTNRRLLPFHLSTLYRTVRLGTPNLGHFQRTLQLHPYKYESLIRILHWDASPSIPTPDFIRTPETVNPVRLLQVERQYFVNLEEVHIVGHDCCVRGDLPEARWFRQNPKLRRVTVRSLCAPTEAIFNMSSLSTINGIPFETIDIVQSSGILLQIRKLPSSTFKIRYCGEDAYFGYFRNLLASMRVVSLHYCNFATEFDTLLQLFHSVEPCWLLELWLFAMNPHGPFAIPNTIYSPHLYRLSIGGHLGFPLTPLDHGPHTSNFAIGNPSLEQLHIGPGVSLLAPRLLEVLRMKKREGNRLQSLKLDNIFSSLPLTSNPTPSDWAVPKWTASCGREDVEQVRTLAKEMGIEISGTAFLGLEILESAEYKKAVEREEEEAAWATDEEK